MGSKSKSSKLQWRQRFNPQFISGRIPCPYPGRIWLEQRGLQRALYWHIEARVVLDLQEILNHSNDRELHFSMVDGDFKKFEGKWCVKSKRSVSKMKLHTPKKSLISLEVSGLIFFSNVKHIYLNEIGG